MTRSDCYDVEWLCTDTTRTRRGVIETVLLEILAEVLDSRLTWEDSMTDTLESEMEDSLDATAWSMRRQMPASWPTCKLIWIVFSSLLTARCPGHLGCVCLPKL